MPDQPNLKNTRIAIIGLGYVGLPLATYFATRYPTVGFDIDERRIDELRAGEDRTLEVNSEEMAAASQLTYASRPEGISDANVFIVTVPTPIDASRQPDLTALKAASRTVAGVLKRGDTVVYESTVYPGATEEICVPILEEQSGLRLNRDFAVGYSPERINPGDAEHRLPDILKITSGSNPEAADFIDALYASIITAGTHKTRSIRVAEAAKVIENVQRDLNIALVNELALLFKKMDIETRDVLSAAGTKWNFHPYQPGLVGGHCIGVDPYYLTYKAQSIGFHPEIILAGRRINDAMAERVANDIIRTMLKKHIDVGEAHILIMGLTFKENCPDTRNTKVADLVRELAGFAAKVSVYDPHADPEEAMAEYGIEVSGELPVGPFDGVVLAVKHAEIMKLERPQLEALLKPEANFVYDVKGALAVADSDARLL